MHSDAGNNSGRIRKMLFSSDVNKATSHKAKAKATVAILLPYYAKIKLVTSFTYCRASQLIMIKIK